MMETCFLSVFLRPLWRLCLLRLNAALPPASGPSWQRALSAGAACLRPRPALPFSARWLLPALWF